MTESLRIRESRSRTVALAQQEGYAVIARRHKVPVWKILEWSLQDPPKKKAAKS